MFCASIIAATTWLWSSFTAVAIAPAVAIPAAAALVVVNRWISSIRLDDGTDDEPADSREASDVVYNI